jgi:hypothetical protein
MGTTTVPIIVNVWLQLSHENDVVTMVTRLNTFWSHVNWCKFCIHLRSLNVRHFRIVETTGLKMMSRLPSVA